MDRIHKPEARKQPEIHGHCNSVIESFAGSEAELIARNAALFEQVAALEALAISRGDDAESYRVLAKQTLHMLHGVQASLTRSRKQLDEVRQAKPDIEARLQAEREVAILRAYVLTLQNQLFDLEERAAA